MTAALITPPALEPVSLAEAKAHLRIDGDDDDALVTAAIVAARVHVEAATRRALIEQGWRVYLDAWPRKRIVPIPIAPLLAARPTRLPMRPTRSTNSSAPHRPATSTSTATG